MNVISLSILCMYLDIKTVAYPPIFVPIQRCLSFALLCLSHRWSNANTDADDDDGNHEYGSRVRLRNWQLKSCCAKQASSANVKSQMVLAQTTNVHEIQSEDADTSY